MVRKRVDMEQEQRIRRSLMGGVVHGWREMPRRFVLALLHLLGVTRCHVKRHTNYTLGLPPSLSLSPDPSPRQRESPRTTHAFCGSTTERTHRTRALFLLGVSRGMYDDQKLYRKVFFGGGVDRNRSSSTHSSLFQRKPWTTPPQRESPHKRYLCRSSYYRYKKDTVILL